MRGRRRLLAEDARDLDSLAAKWAAAPASALDLKYAYQRSRDASRGQRSKSDLISREKPQPPEA